MIFLFLLKTYVASYFCFSHATSYFLKITKRIKAKTISLEGFQGQIITAICSLVLRKFAPKFPVEVFGYKELI